MRQLTGLDAAFLNMEHAAAPLHVGSVIVVDPSTAEDAGYDRLLRTIRERLHLVPPFRWRLAHTPFGLDHPYWVDDPDFDLEYHVRRIAVPPPADDHGLAEIIARIHARPLDRSRPLWELYLIEGLPDGRQAVYTKVHHAAVDGVSGAELLSILLDVEPDPPAPEPQEITPESDPTALTQLGWMAKGVAKQPIRIGRAVARSTSALPLAGRMIESALPDVLRNRTGDGLIAGPRVAAPRTMFNAPLSPHRRFAFAAMPLDAVKDVKNAHGCKLNDVVMALVAGGLRRYLERHDALPDEPLQAAVPISVRTPEQVGQAGNAVNSMFASLATNVADPAERLRVSASAMDVAKESNALPATILRDMTQFAVPALAASAARTITRLRWSDRVRAPVNVVVSNVPGPPIPLYYAGARMEGIYPVSVVSDGMGLNITVFSYLDKLQFGLVADRDLVPDLWDMMDDIQKEMELLHGLVA